MDRKVISGTALAVLLAALVVARSSGRAQNATKPAESSATNQSPDSKPKADSALAPSPAPETPKKGASAPDFTLTDLRGNKLQLSSLKGKAVVVNFWATWCEPCKIEMPWLVDLQKKYGPQGLQILGVAMDDAEEQAIRDFAQKMGVNYPVLKGTEALADLYGGLDGLPATFFVDRSGKISDEAIGLMSQSLIEDSIKHALGPAPTGEKQP